MRRRVSTNGVTVQAIAGNHAVFFGLDLADAARPGCLGFSIHREDHTDNEQYWIYGFKTFESVVPHPDPNARYRTREHPLQSFYWGDYTAKPAHRYTYRFVPRFGAPKNLQDHEGVEAAIEVSTSNPDEGTHGVYFNRGVAASQAYQFKFDDRPDRLPPEKETEALKWLSRGLVEAMVAFIDRASSPGDALRASVYEFTEPRVLEAFGRAHETGADVKIVYHARDDETGDLNRKAIEKAGLDAAILIPRTNTNIAHNKFIIFCEKGNTGELVPISTWTGSTNLSQGGIFGHSNVGHAVRDGGIAAHFLEYWEVLKDDPELDDLRDWVTTNSPFDADALDTTGVRTLFSPRHGLAPLNWYADRLGAAEMTGHITEAFGVGTVFEKVLEDYTGDALHYVMLERKDSHQDQWAKWPRILVAVGSEGGPDTLSRWAKERLTGFNSRIHYLHTKILLVDPLGSDPMVITGSANFSPGSTNANDENMLVIKGDTEVADVYFTEFARIFNHFYARYWASELAHRDGATTTASFLEETPEWQKPYFEKAHPKSFQRVVFSSEVAGNS